MFTMFSRNAMAILAHHRAFCLLGMAGNTEIMHHFFSLSAPVALRTLFYAVIIPLLVMTGETLYAGQLVLPV
jgi:hypothetical protein